MSSKRAAPVRFPGIWILVLVLATCLSPFGGGTVVSANTTAAPAACTAISSPDDIPSPTLINFDDLPSGTNIGNHYQATAGVRFEDSRSARVVTHALRLGSHSVPNVAQSQAIAPNTPDKTPLNIYFDSAQTHVGMYIGNGDNEAVAGLFGYDADGNQICSARVDGVPNAHTQFIGIHDTGGRIVRVSLLYVVATGQAESIDDLQFTNAPATPTLFVFPASAKPGTQLHLSGYDFQPNAQLSFALGCSGQPDTNLGTDQATSAGQLSAQVTLPLLPAADCTLTAWQGEAPPGQTSFTVLPALSLTLSPQQGPPGTQVHFTASGLTPGRLRLLVDGVPVVWDQTVTGTSASGDFLLPAAPASAAANATAAAVEALNYVNGQQAGQATQTFTRQAGPPPPTYQIQDVSFPQDEILPGQPVTITGHIDPAPLGDLSGYQIHVLWKDTSGQIVPIGLDSTLQADGGFQAQARFPSLINGSPVSADSDGQVGVVLTYDRGAHENIQSISIPTRDFRIKVVGPDGQPIPDAIVRTHFLGQGEETSSPSSGNGQETVDIGLQDLYASPNQLTNVLNQTQPDGTPDPFACQASDLYGRTDANGIFKPKFDWELADILGSQIPVGGQLVYVFPVTTTIPVEVNALFQGFGEVQDGTPTPTVKQVLYNAATRDFYDAATGKHINVVPLVIQVPALPQGVNPTIPIEPTVGGGVKKKSPGLAFGDFLSLAQAVQDPPIQLDGKNNGELTVEFEHDPQLAGNLSNVHFWLDGQDKGAFDSDAIPGKKCTLTRYYFTLPHAYLVAAGWHRGQIRADTAIGPVSSSFWLKFVEPPAWFLNQSYRNKKREANLWAYPFVDLQGTQLPSNSTASIGANVPRVGQLNNSAGAESLTVQSVYPSGGQGVLFSGQTSTQALNNNAPPKPFSGSGGGVQSASQVWAQSLAQASGNTIHFGEQNIPILDSGWVPLFRYQWGVWPIASASVGADMWFNAKLSYGGTITIDPAGGSSSSHIEVHPQATVSVKAWFDLSALFGLIDAGADARPSINVHVPVSFDNGVKSAANMCFGYGLDVDWWWQVGVCPLCDNGGGTKPIFHGHIPDPLPALCQKSLAASMAESSPPMSSPGLASDGLGHTVAVWSGADGSLLASAYDGLLWHTPTPVSGSSGASEAKVAFYAPGQAAAVWTTTDLTEEQIQTLPMTDTVKAQHLAYATWDVVADQWSTPAKLTQPNTGEGGVVLAGCPSTDPVCPAGGAVTAVWLRDAAGAMGERQFRLFYATFQNGAWSSAAAVDPDSTATDSMPSVAYFHGQPLVFWIRDADRSLATLADRRLVYRILDGTSSVQQPDAFPAGAETPSLAVQSDTIAVALVVAHDAQALIGNQRTLYSAETTCPSLAGCTWTVKELTDSHGRAIRAERPVMDLDKEGKPVITFRGLGFGPVPGSGLHAYPGDAPGMTMGTGELAQVDADPTASVYTPSYLTSNGAVNWQAAATYNPIFNSVVAMAVQGQTPLSSSQMAAAGLDAAQPSQTIAQDEPVVFATAPRQPDFVVTGLVPSTQFPQAEEPVDFALQIRNDGAAADGPVQVALVQDGAYGVGESLGSGQVPALAAGATTTVTVQAALTGNVNVTHTVTAVVNPLLQVAERNLANNSRSTELGSLPAPTDLRVAVKPAGLPILLAWTGPDDARVVGYRVYRAVGDGPFQPIGASPVTGFADLIELPGYTYRYAVAAYAADGSESALSQAASAALDSTVTPIDAPNQLYLPWIVR